MSENTKIEWADHTFNPWEGCQKVGPGCDHCYAETRNARFGGGVAVNWGPGAPRRRTSTSTWAMPARWNIQAEDFMAQHGRRQRVFCASLADVFDNAVDPMWRADLFWLIKNTPNLDWLLLTKRIGNAKIMMADAIATIDPMAEWVMPLPNVWLGATIVNQEEADRDIPKLLAVPASKRFLSMEPLLAPVNLRHLNEDREFNEVDCLKPDRWDDEVERWRDTDEGWEEQFEDHYDQHPAGLTGPMHVGIDWVIVGGESGPGARPMHPDWARSLRDQCEATGVPFMFKQWGEHDLSYDRDRDDPDYRRCDKMSKLPGRWINLAGGHGFNGDRVHYAHRIGKKAAGRLLDGRTWDGVPT